MPTARERQENLRRRARTGQSSDEIEENKISDDYETALKQLAKIGYAPAPTKREEPEALEVMEDTDGGLMTFGKSVARGAVGIPAGTLEFLGIGSAWLKGKAGFSDDVEDNTFYDWGKSLKKEGVLGVGAEGYIPNRFRGGTAGFVAVDAPQGLGSAAGFIGEAALTGGIATAVKTGLKKGAKKAAVKGDALPKAVREASDEADALAINLALKSGGDDVTREALEKEGKRLSPVAAKNKEAAEEKIRASMKAEADEKFKKNAARYSIVGIGGAVQASEGYHDAYNTLLSEARAEGRNYLTREEVDMAFNAAFANFPAGMVEVFGVELPVLRAIYGAKKGVADAATKKLIQDKGSESFLRKTKSVTKTRAIFDNLDFNTGGRFSRGLSRFAPLAGGASREALEEAVQSFWMNMVASEIIGYDENRQLFDGVAKDSGVGGVAGFIFGAANLVMGRKRAKLMDIDRAVQQAERAEKAGNTEAAEEFRRQANELTEAFNQTEAVNESAVDDEHSEMQAAQEAQMNAEGEVATEEGAEEGAGLGLTGKGQFSTYGLKLRPLSSWSDKDQAEFRRLNPDYRPEEHGDPVYIGSTGLPVEERIGEQLRPESKYGAYLAKEYPAGGAAEGIGQEGQFKTREEAVEGERALVSQSPAFVSEKGLMQPTSGIDRKPRDETKAQKRKRQKRENTYKAKENKARAEQKKEGGKAQKFIIPGKDEKTQGSFVLTPTGEIEKFGKATEATARVNELNRLAEYTAKKREALGDKPFAVQPIPAGLLGAKPGQKGGPKFLVVSKDKTVRMDDDPRKNKANRAKAMQMLGLAEGKPAEGKPAKEEKPAKKGAERKSAAASRVIDSRKFTPAAAALIQQAQRGETTLSSDEIAAAVTPTGANNKINKGDVEKFFKENDISTEAQQAPAQTEAPASTAAAAETASGADAAIIKQMRAALNANADTEADADQISAATLDPKVLSLLDQLSPSVAKESPSFGAWASSIMIKTGADPALLPYLKASYNRLSSTTSGLELTPEADVNGAVGDAIIDLLQTQLSSKKKVVSKKPASKKEVDDAFFAKQNARRFGLDPSGIRSLNQLLSKLGVPKGLIFFNEDGTSILAAGAGEPAPIVNVTPQERAEALENTDKLARLEIMERSHKLGLKRLRAKEALRASLQNRGFNKLIELEFFGDIQNEADRKAALEKLDNDIALLKQKREENAKVFEKEFPGFLSSDASAARIKKELSAKASKSVSSYEVEEITLEGTYKTLAAARRAGRALQKKQPNKAVGMLKTKEGTYNVYSEFLGPRKVTPQPVENAAEFVMHLNELKSRTPNVIETTLNVSQQDVIAGLNIDFTGDSLSEKEGRNNIDAYVKKLAERLRYSLSKTGILDKIPLDDGTFYERGLAGQIALEVAKITTGTGSHRGVVIKNIRFGKSSSRRTEGQLLNKKGSFNKNWRMINRGAPMYTTPADGHDTIYIDPTALIDALATGGHTIEEFIAHELDHVLTIRAIRSAVIHQINLNGDPMTDERIEKKISDLFRNIWNNHKDHALRLALEGDTDLLDAMGQADGDYSGIGQSQRMRLEDGDIVGGSKATASQKGAEWMRALMRRAIGEKQGRGKMPYSIGDIASKYSAGKVFGWMSLLTRADVGLAKDDALPFAVEEMISAAGTVGHGSNVFVQRAAQLGDDIKMVVNRNVEFLMGKISNYYSGSAAPKDLGGNVIKRLEDGSPGAEPSFFSAHTPYFEDKIIKEAGILHEKLSDIDNVIFMPLSQINEGQLVEEHRGVKSGKRDFLEAVSLRWISGGKEQYGWASTSFENEWQNENGDNAWTYKVSSKDILLKEIAEENNTTVKAIQLNNPSLGEISSNTSLPAGTRILMHGRPTGVKGGFSTNALLTQAWRNAVQNNAPVKLRRDTKADNFLKKAIMRLDELRNSNASAEEITQAEDNVGDAQIAADLAADAIANSTRSSTNDLQGRTDRIRMLSQSQMLKEIPSTRQLMLQELEENETVPNFGPPAESMNPLEDETDMKSFSQISEEKTVLMKILQEKGSLALLRSLDLNVSTRDLINLIDNLMEPHTLEGMLSRGAVKRKGARSRAGLSYLAGVIEKSHNAAVRRLRKLEKEKDELYRKMNLPETDVLTRKQYGERVLQLIKDIRKARVQHFDGTAPAAEGNDLSQLTNPDKEAIARESEEEILFQRDEDGVPTGVEINDMIGVIGQMIVESDFMNAVRGEALGPVLPSVEQAREELTSDAAAEESWGDMLFNDLSDETNFAWKTKSELEMVGTDPTTGKPIYDYVTHAPWESNNRRVIREAVVNEETGEVIVPALTKSTKENWDRYIEGGGKKPWQHHVMGYTDRLNYIPSSHQMRVISAALRQWSRRSEQFGAATMPETEGTRRWVDDFWNLAEEIRDVHRVEKTVKSRSKVGKGKKVESHTMEESDAMMRSFAGWILTGNPKGDRGDGPAGNPSEILHRFEEILRSIKDNPRFWSINDYANLTNALRLAAADLKGYWDTREDQLNADELMRYDQLIVAAEDFQVDEMGQIGGALSLQRSRNQLLGVTADFFNWQRKIRELQEKHLGKLVDNDFLEKVKGLITEASRVASNKVVTTEIVEELGKVASGDVRLKLSESLEVLEWDKGANAPKYQVRTSDLYAALEERFSDELTPADLQKLTKVIKTKWANARKAEFEKLLGSAGLHDGATLTVSNLVNSADAILKARDRGAFSRQKVVKAGKKEVSVALTKLWDALAPETNLPYGQDKTSQMLSNIQDRIRKKELKGVEAAQLRYKVLKEVMSRKDLAWLSEEMARDLWYAGALSGLRTFVDIGLGGTVNSFMSTVSAATDLYLTRRAENPKEDAYNVFAAYVRAWLYEGLPMFFDILKTGNMSSLPDANERLTKQMQEDFYGGENLDAMDRKLKMEGKPWYHPKRLGTLGRFSRRFVLGLDYVSAQAGRKAMMVYGASGRLWSAKKAGDGKDLSELKKQYEQTRKFGDKQAQERAKKAARESLEDSLGGDVKITNAMVIAKSREIMEQNVSLDLIESSNELGRVFALNSDPIGIGAPIHEAAQKFGVLKYGAGLAFSRAALNMIAVATNYLPGLGWINAARTLKFTNRKLEEWGVNDTGWAKLINLRHSDNPISEERAKVIQLQATVGTIVAAAFWQMLDDDDWEVHGSMENLPINLRRQLMSQGVKPYSIRYKDGAYVSVKATPLAMLVGAFGNMQEGQRYLGNDPMTTFKQFQAINFTGFTFAMDVGPAAYAMRMMEMVKNTDDEYTRNQILGQFFQGYVGPIISPTLLREIDTVLHPKYYRPGKDQPLAAFWSQLVIVPGTGLPRRAGMRPMLNALGDPVEIKRTPWSRWVQSAEDDPVWQVIAEKSLEGVYLPGASPSAKITTRSGERRDMNPAELYEYRQRTGQYIKAELTRDLERFRNLNPQQSSDWLDSRAKRIRSILRLEIGKRAD